MKRYRIAVQEGLDDLKKYLLSSGFEIVPSGRELQADVTIIADEDESDEPMPSRVTYTDKMRKQRILIDASHLSNEEVVELLTMGLHRHAH
jgi:hypothetical protein